MAANTDSQTTWNDRLNRLKRSLTAKVLVLGLIILLLLLPYFLTIGLRQGREDRMRRAEREVGEKWGQEQLVTAPVLRIPMERRQVAKNDKGEANYAFSCFFALPTNLKIDCTLQPEIRYRGIYQILLYKAQIHLEGDFTYPELPGDWRQSGEPSLLFRFSDVKGLESLETAVNAEKVKPASGEVISLPVTVNAVAPGQQISVIADTSLKGSRTLLFSPIGQNFSLTMHSPWEHPSFTGGFLPTKREISGNGFQAEWSVNELNSSFSQTWIGTRDMQLPPREPPRLDWRGGLPSGDSSLGVTLKQPAGIYQQVERVSDYAFLLIAIVLIAFLIGEQLTRIWIHPLQYFFVGLSLILFYVLLLALAEHLNFSCSYLLSTLLISGLTTAYCRMIFAGQQRASWLLGTLMLLAYALIYALISLEDYALLTGSAILLIILAVLMRLTGHLNHSPAAKG